MLHRIAQSVDGDALENDIIKKVSKLNDGFYLAEHGLYGNLKDMNSELDDFIKDYVKYAELF